MPDFREALTRKVGPLPVWAWGGVVGGGLLVAKALTGGSGGASVSPQAIGTGVGDLPDLGDAAGAGSAVANPLGYVTLPDGTIVLDKPTSDLTIIPKAPTPAATPAPRVPRWGSDVPSAISKHYSSASAAKILDKLGVKWGTSINLVDLAQGLRKKKISYGTKVDAKDVKKLGVAAGTGDTSYSGQGDTTPRAMVATVPSMPPLPIGNVLALPTYDPVQAFRGPMPTFSTTPIASSARIVMPPVNGETTGSVVVPRIPETQGRQPARRLLAPVTVAADRLTPHTPPTTYRPRLRVASWVTRRADTIARRNVSG